VIPHGLPGRVVSLPAHRDRRVVVVTGTTLYDQRTAYRLEQECGGRLSAWLMLAESTSDASGGRVSATGRRARGRLRGHLRLGPGHLIRLARSLPRRLRERRAWGERPRALAHAEQRLLAEEIEAYRRRSQLFPQRLDHPVEPALADALRATGPGLVVAASPGLIPPEVARSWDGPMLTVYPGWSPTIRGENPVEAALFRRNLQELGATVHLLTATAELGPMFRRSQACLLPWDGPESCRHRVLALGTELLSEVGRQLLDRGEIVAYDAPVGTEGFRLPPLDGPLLAMLETDRRHGWLAAALRDTRRF
jgi:folate-dependent phosphoribosylglycinamide formyltransferase PurN